MRLLRLEVRHFGKLEETVLEPNEGLNVYCHPNEFGKTTLIYFIYYMFYGYNAKQLKKYQPWSGAEMAGSLTFEQDGRTWRIDRRHPARGMEKRQVLCLTNGEEKAFANQEQPGPYFLGLDGETFLRSFCITQGDVVFARTDGLDVALKNMAATGDENVSFRQAEDWLNKEHTKYMYRGKSQGPLLEKKERLAADSVTLSALKQELDRQILAHREWKALEKSIPESDQKMKELRERLGKAEKSDALKLLERLRALKERKPMDPPAVGKDRLEAWASAYDEKIRTEEALETAEQEKARLNEQASLLMESAGQFGFHALSARDIEKVQDQKGFPWGAVLLAAAVVTDALAMFLSFPWLYALGGGLLIGAVALFLGKRLARRRICHGYGTADPAQLMEKWEKYGQVVARSEEAKEAVRSASEAAEVRRRERDSANERFEQMRAETRIFSAEELQEQKVLWGVYENSLKQSQTELQEQTLLGGRSLAEVEALAEGAEPIEETAGEIRVLLDDAEAENRALRIRREELDPRALEQLWNRIIEMKTVVRQIRKEVADGEEQLFAVKTALGWLKEANEEMNTHFAPRLCSLAGEHLSLLTNGKYDTLLLDSQFGISLVSPEGIYPVETFSAGTRDAVYFAFRLAVSELLGEETLPMVLDDPFTNLDDERRGAAENLLKIASETRQILYFTCRN